MDDQETQDATEPAADAGATKTEPAGAHPTTTERTAYVVEDEELA